MKEKIKKFVKDHKKEIALVTVTSVVSIVVCKKVSGPSIRLAHQYGFLTTDDGVYLILVDKKNNLLGGIKDENPAELVKWLEAKAYEIKELCD